MLNVNVPQTTTTRSATEAVEAAKTLVLPRVIVAKEQTLSSNSLSALVVTTDGAFVCFVLALDGAAASPPTSQQVVLTALAI